MRPAVVIMLCGALAGPTAARAQPAAPGYDVPPTEAAIEADRPAGAAPSPDPAAPPGAILPEAPSSAPTSDATPAPAAEAGAQPTVAPVTVEPNKKKPLVTARDVHGVAGGVVGGLAGAAILGPIGKIAGGFLGKHVAQVLMGGKKDRPAEAPQVAQAGSPAPATAPAVEGAATPPGETAAVAPSSADRDAVAASAVAPAAPPASPPPL